LKDTFGERCHTTHGVLFFMKWMTGTMLSSFIEA
jgi:hypothetical protein